MAEFTWKTVTVPLTVRNDGPRIWKQYRWRGGLRWRKYGREVKGAHTFVEAFGIAADYQRQRMTEMLTTSIWERVCR